MWYIHTQSTSTFWYVLKCWENNKPCRPWSDAAFCGIRFVSTLSAQAYLSEYLDENTISVHIETEVLDKKMYIIRDS